MMNPKPLTLNSFYEKDFQQRACELALKMIKENNFSEKPATKALLELGLNDSQVKHILNKISYEIHLCLKEMFSSNIGIETELFESELYQAEILNKAKSWIENDFLDFWFISYKLMQEGLSDEQVGEVFYDIKQELGYY